MPHAYDGAHHTVGAVRDEVRGAKAQPHAQPAAAFCGPFTGAMDRGSGALLQCSLCVVLVERFERVRSVREMLCARIPTHLVQVLGLLA
jgi:hypothetical protein